MKLRIHKALGDLLVACLILIIGLTTGCTCKVAPQESPGGFIDFLSVVPVLAAFSTSVQLNDYKKAREQLGLELPSVTDSADDIVAYVTALQAGGVWTPAPDYLPGWEDMWGYNLLGVDRDIQAGVFTISPTRIILGEFDVSKVEFALESQDYIQQSYLGYPLFSWGEDLEEREGDLHGSENKRRIAVAPHYLVMSDVMDKVKRTLEVIGNVEDSLAGNVDFIALARSMNESGAYSVFLSDEIVSLDEVIERFDLNAEQKLEISRYALQEYRAWGLGISRHKGQYTLHIFSCYDNDLAAIENAQTLIGRLENGRSLIRRDSPPWTDYFSTIKVFAEGRVVHAKMIVESARSWIDMLYSEEFHLILAYE